MALYRWLVTFIWIAKRMLVKIRNIEYHRLFIIGKNIKIHFFYDGKLSFTNQFY